MKLPTSYAVKSVSDKQSQLDIDVNMKMSGIMWLMEPFMAGGVRKVFNAITAEIKKMIEGKSSTSPPAGSRVDGRVWIPGDEDVPRSRLDY